MLVKSFTDDLACRTPHGVRGLKLNFCISRNYRPQSHPARGAWIEIISGGGRTVKGNGRTPHGVRGLKYFCRRLDDYGRWSHPARGAWIEIGVIMVLPPDIRVAPRMGCVD